MDLARPEFLSDQLWLYLYCALALALLVQQAYAHRQSISDELAKRFGPGFSFVRGLFKLALWGTAAWFLLLALATPLGEPVKIEGEANGADIILAVDVSSSMYAQDVRPNRLTALKEMDEALINKLDGDRVGIVAFAGDSVIACPLTTDYETASTFLDKLSTDSVPSDGTGFAPAIKLCLDGFQMDPKRGRLVVFATDGEDTLDTDGAAQAKRAGALGVPIYTVGIGTPQGAMIPGRPDIFGRVMPKLYHGQPIIARTNPETLRQIASLSGGRFFDGSSPEALNAAYETLRSLKRSNVKSPDRYVRDPLYQKPLLIAIALLLIEMFISNRRGGLGAFAKASWAFSRRLLRRRQSPAGLLLLSAFLSMAFSLDPGQPEYDQGNAAYRQNQYDQAASAYQNSIQENGARLQPHYNLGNAKFMQGDYDGAIQAYEDALKIDPNDEDSKFNLDLAKKMEEDQKKNPQKKKQDEKKKQNGNQKQPNGGQNQSNQGQPQQQSGNQNGGQNGQQNGGQQSGKGQDGQGQKSQGQSGGSQNAQAGQGAQGQSGAQAQALSQDQIRAMMNMLKSDQHQYQGAFQPLKRYEKPEDQPQDPMQEMFEEMTGHKMQPTPAAGDSDRKDW